MTPIDLVRLHHVPRVLDEAQRYTAGGLHRLARERIDVAVIALLRAAGLRDREVSVVRAMLERRKSRGVSDYDAGHADGRIVEK